MEHVAQPDGVPYASDGNGQIRDLLRRMPADVARTFTTTQLEAMHDAIATRKWGRHPLDIRGSVPFGAHRYFFAILAGRNRRDMSQREKLVDNLFAIAFFLAFVGFCMVTGFVTLYLIKSAVGIDIFDNWHFGLWTCVQENVL
ncbi:MAG: 3-phosphoshikimate 1-carboxyvinyltransferase [Pseudomonadales bacterium]|nr:3-phosphoshikimate 1-carboxyvinyltransferase [Pseudomonadales bacterium]MCP5184781.1 3-phosphoshikimate 1-carboxyvinyltransferase [Pseudomonadales bacterium]